MSKPITLAAVLAMILLTAACGGAGSGSVGEEVTGFTATTLDGDEFSLADKQGEVVALYFMAAY